jgi:hypothetical protein
MKVFISSVTAGLEQERKALPGLILGLGMDPVRFEDFTAAPSPSREVCLRAVAECDVYLLLLGEHYGHPFPDTGLSPTHEEYRAAVARGLPVLAFRKRGASMDAQQVAFAAEVEAYQAGVFRSSFSDVGELLAESGKALRDLPAATGQLVFAPIGRAVEVRWRTSPEERSTFTDGGPPGVEVYLSPIGVGVGSSQLRAAADIAPRVLREIGQVGQSVAIEIDAKAHEIAARVTRTPVRRNWIDEAEEGAIQGLAMQSNGEMCAWCTLRRDSFGALVDERSMMEVITPLVLVAGHALAGVLRTTEVGVVPSVAITGAQRVTVGRPETVGQRSRATMPMSGSSVVTLPGDESAVLAAVVQGSRDVASELAARAVSALARQQSI